MSVQTQIDRISGNVTAALAAIAEKGVTVPDGSGSDALAALIAAIEAGGGGGADLDFGFDEIETGTYTPATDSHCSATNIGYDAKNKNKVYLAFIWCKELVNGRTNPASNRAMLAGFSVGAENADGYIGGGTRAKRAIANAYLATSGLVGGTGTTLSGSETRYFTIYDSSSYYIAGYTYEWIAWRRKV